MTVDVKTTCPYCGVGCGVIATRQDNGDVTIKGDPDHPANFGRLCSKGSALGETLALDNRVLYPEINGQRASFEEALALVASKFSAAIAEHGADSVAFYVSGQCLTEDYYVANKLMKGFIGSANIDTNSRLCMASSVAGHRRAFGSDTVPGTYEDLELADLIILTGSNLAWCHPVLYQRIAAAKARRPKMKIVVIDPRRTMTCDIADLYLPVRPDSDVALFIGLLAYLSINPVFDHAFVEAHCVDFQLALKAANKLTVAETAAATGLSIAQLKSFYGMFAGTEKTVTCYSQGVNQSSSGSDKVNAIINCHLATGRIGKPGMGPFSLTGQPNAMGGREVGGLANTLAAHMAIENAEHRAIVQTFWNAPTIADRPGLKAVDMFKAVSDGHIKALWIMATNPVVSMPEADRVREAIANCPFVVVSDIEKNTDTVELAHVLLPALGWGEKDGTVTNSERRISRQRSFLDFPGEAMADWRQMAEVGRRMGFGDAFAFETAADVFSEHAALSAYENNGERDFDIGAYSGIKPAEYDALAPFQWPQARGEDRKETRFFADGAFFAADRRARFVPVSWEENRRQAGQVLTLNTGRIRDQWHTMTRTGKTARLTQHIAEPFAEIHPTDAFELGIADATLMQLENAHGIVVVRALLTDRQARGSIFVPMHWSAQQASNARVDVLVTANVDPISGQPASKQALVTAKPFQTAAYGFAVLAQRPESLDARYWALSKAEGGWRVELAFAVEPEDWADYARHTFGLPDHAEPIGYSDRTQGIARVAFFDGGKLLAALFVAREPVAVSRNWAIGELAKDHTEIGKRFGIVAGRPGVDQPDPGATVCSCFSIGVNQIVAAAKGGAVTVEAIGHCLKAGTNCGSCRAEIREIVDGCLVAAAE
jgi:assimilatory nitrate reductase catalytic subunit